MKRLLTTSLFLLFIAAVLAQPKPLKLWADVPGMKRMPSKLYISPAPADKNTGIWPTTS